MLFACLNNIKYLVSKSKFQVSSLASFLLVSSGLNPQRQIFLIHCSNDKWAALREKLSSEFWTRSATDDLKLEMI